jgi:endonuclease/exonuclease/phosphatase (EEP) superfamily protein YafD
VEWAVAGALAGWAAARLAGIDQLRCAEAWAVPALSFTPQVTAGAWVSALLLRGAGPAAVAAAAGAALTAVVGPRAVPYRQPPAAGPVLRVLTANLLAGRAEAGVVVDLVRRLDADVLFVQELTGDADAAGQAGHGLSLTWGPRSGRRPALLAIDHVLIDRRCAVLTTLVHLLPGSDHRALYAQLRLPAPRNRVDQAPPATT